MSSFLFTTIAAVVGVVVLAPSYATNIPTTNPGCTTTVLGADNIANGSASLEPDFSANTINTTWFSNGEQLTGNNIPGTCRYDAALTPPTPAARPGYTFGGWRLRVPAVPAGPFDNLDASIAGTNIGYSNICYNQSAAPYGYDIYEGINETEYLSGQSFSNGEWAVQLSNGGVIRGVAKCSYGDGEPGFVFDEMEGEWSPVSVYYYGASGDRESYNWPPNKCDYNFGEDEYGGSYCLCKVTGYQASGAALQTDDSTSWVFLETIQPVNAEYGSDLYACPWYCAARCATVARNSSSFREALYGQSQ